MTGRKYILEALLLAGALAGSCMAQIDTRINPPDPSTASPAAAGPVEPAPASRALSGILNPIAPILPGRITTSLNVSEGADSQPSGAGLNSGFDELTRISGRFSMERNFKLSTLQADYSGGGDFYVRDTGLDRYFNVASVTATIPWSNATMIFGAHYSYTPESGIGYADTHGGSDSLSGQTGSDTGILSPNNSTTIGSASAEIDLHVTPGDIVNFSGTYGQSRFGAATFQDTNQGTGTIGYTHISGRTSLGTSFQFAQFNYPGTGSSIVTQSPQFSFRKQINASLTVFASGGPEIRSFEHTEFSPGTSVTTSGSGGVEYLIWHSTFGLNFSRGTTGGSGVLRGSETNSISTTMNRQIGPYWTLSSSAGYSRNTSLLGLTTQFSQRYNSVFATAEINRRVSTRFSTFLSYSLRTQRTGGSFCAIGTCQMYPASNQFTIGFDFHPRDFTGLNNR